MSDGDEESFELYALAASMLEDCKQAGQLSDLSTIIRLLQEALTHRSGSHPLRFQSTCRLAAALLIQSSRTDKLEDLDEAILLLKEVSELNPEITRGVLEEQDQHGIGSHQGDEISIGDIATALPDDESEAESTNLTDLANGILLQFNQSAELPTLNTVITLHALSLRLAPHSERWVSLRGLAASLVLRFHRTNQTKDLDESISLVKAALLLCPKPHSGRPDLLNDLSAALATRFAVTAQPMDLQDAVHSRNEVLNMGECDSIIDDLKSPIKSWPKPSEPPTALNYAQAAELLVKAVSMMRGLRDQSLVSDIDPVILLYRNILTLIDSSTDLRWVAFQGLAICCDSRFQRTRQLADVEEMIKALRGGLEICRVASARSFMLSYLSHGLATRFNLGGHPEDLDEAVTLFRESSLMRQQSRPPSSRQRQGELQYFSRALSTRYNLSHRDADLDELISVGHELLELRPVTHPDRPTALDDLACHLYTRFTKKQQLTDLDDAITLRREAIQLMHNHHRSCVVTLNNHGLALRKRFGKTGRYEDLTEAISMHREVLMRLPKSDPKRLMALGSLEDALLLQDEANDQSLNTDELIPLLKEVVQIQRSDYRSLNRLAIALYNRSRSTLQISDLNDAVALHQEVLALLPETHADRAQSLDSFATTLRVRAFYNGQVTDLDKAVTLLREVMEMRPAPHEKRPWTLNNIGSAYEKRFLLTGQVADLDESVALLREALSLISKDHPERASTLNNLGCALDTRFEQTRQSADLTEAVALHREALEYRPRLHPERPFSIVSLASVLLMRSVEEDGLNSINEAIAIQEEIIELLPARDPNRNVLTDNLASALDIRFMKMGHRKDVDRAIELHRKAVDMRPAPDPMRPDSLFNLAVTLGTLYDRTHHLPDLEESIVAYRESLQLLPLGHPKICRYSIGLAIKLVSMWLDTQQQEYLNDAIATLRSAVSIASAPVSWRFDGAYIWALHADGRHESALEAYQAAIQLLPQLATLGLDLQSRHESLSSGSDGLARRAAACAIRSGQISKAVELLEEGRAIFWSQALQLRTPLDELRSVSRDLAQKLEGLALVLEQGSFRAVPQENVRNFSGKQSMEQEAIRYRQLNEDWLSTLEDIRKLDGFKEFLIAKPVSALQEAAKNGPVAILNITRSECSALVVSLSSVRHVPLPHVTLKDVHSLVNLLQLVAVSSARSSVAEDARSLIQQLQTLPETLAQRDRERLWLTIAEPVIKSLGLHKSNSPPRLWWCPTGQLAFLPIHAAGIYDDTEAESVSDYVISSYTPTLTAIIGPPPPPCTTIDEFKLMAVIQPKGGLGYAPLPATREELARIQKHVPPENLVCLGIPGAPALIDTVLSHLPTVSIAHFACHGEQGAMNPLSSALILEDGQLNLSRIMKQSIPRATLAFLSACQTSTGDAKLPDEAIHLAAALLFTGFRGTVATMWSIADSDGPNVADTFYGKLFHRADANSVTPHISQCPDTTQAAEALHLAITKLRKDGCSFVRWVPFIHMGM